VAAGPTLSATSGGQGSLSLCVTFTRAAPLPPSQEQRPPLTPDKIGNNNGDGENSDRVSSDSSCSLVVSE